MEDIKSDSRFAHIVSDPKFRPMPKSKKKVKIDSRFQTVFNNKHFSHKVDIDKRGRPILDSSKRNKNVMQRFYELSGDEIEVEISKEASSLTKNNEKRKKKKKLGENQATETSQQSELKHREQLSKVKGEGNTRKAGRYVHNDRDTSLIQNLSLLQEHEISGVDNVVDDDEESDEYSSNSDEDSSNSDDEEDNDGDELPEFTQEHVLEETEIDHKWNELHTDAPTVVESTHRLAVCNMDWDFVKAQDLFVLFKSFVSGSGSVKSVTIYPSEFGKERMAEEARLGPKELREHSGKDSMVTNDADGGNKKKKRGPDLQKVKKSTKEQEAMQTEKLREYQLNRLRYYFAVVECDSASTAETIYNQCDGREYLLSSVTLDLRFIPDGMIFDDAPKDSFSENQSILDYEPNKFSSTALCQAKVDVTWDETEFDRLSRRVASLQRQELENIVEENKYADIIAPPESDSEEDVLDREGWLKDAMDGSEDGTDLTEEDKIALYRKLLMSGVEEGEEEESEKEEGDKEIVWQPGLKSSLVKKIQKKERQQAETGVVNEYLEKKREKKRKKKEEKIKQKSDNKMDIEDSVNSDNVINNDSHLQETARNHSSLKKKRKRSLADETGADTADLELLVMGDDDDLKQVRKDDAKLSKKQKKLLKKKKLSEDKTDFQLDVNDPRFAALYTSHHYHIDPTASQFKKTKNMSALVNEQIKRRGNSDRAVISSIQNGSSQKITSSKSLSQTLVDSLKLKMNK